ncbi:MAG: hypothetical protein AB1649_27995 [Chloroflexota bacterium]
MNDSNQSKPFWQRRIHPALALWLLAPIFGELFSGSTPLNEYISPFSILLLGMLYGSGAILVRELVIRWQKGWRALLLLGMAYGIYEEGLMVRSFFDPNWMDLDHLGVYGRAAGVNWVWTEHLTIFHALISIAASIVFVEILYPDRRIESWVGRRGLTWNLIALVVTLPLGALLNPYDTPDIWLAMCWLAITLLGFAAFRGSAAIKEAPVAIAPHPRRFWWTAFIGWFVQFFVIYFTAENNSPHFVVSMILIALFDLFVLRLILHWSDNGRNWDDRHRLALINGSLSFFLVIGMLTTGGQYPIMYFSNPVFLAFLWWISRRINQRVKGENAPSPVIITAADSPSQP